MAGLRTERLIEFTDWVAKHITGDEKGEAQIFLDRLFIAFGQKGIKEAGATLEMRVKKGSAGGTAFADLVWKPVVLIEMKRRGEDLNRHYRQAFDYWTRLVPGRPRCKNPLKDAHAALHAAVLTAYGFTGEYDLLAQLLELNLAVAARIAAGQPVTAPGAPATYPDPQRLVTEDCIRP
jgi:hypothetical protein